MPTTATPGYTVSFPEVAGASGSLTAAAGDLRGELLSLERAVAALLGPGWRGRAASGFASEWRTWQAAALDVVAALEVLAELVRSGGSRYELTEADVRQAVSR
jgi:WXG100 family type VII secretion target